MKNQIQRVILKLPEFVRTILFFGRSRCCSLCNTNLRKFLDYGVIPRQDALCPICGSLERHRLVWLFLKRHTNLFDENPKTMLHVAPEKMLVDRISKANYIQYLTADLYSDLAEVKMDITNIQYSENSFDVIYCSHVLEHVSDDLQASRELFRVLKPGGWALILVPITSDKTFEDSTITDPDRRELIFGNRDHVRIYGPDFPCRLQHVGFSVKEFIGLDIVDHSEIIKFGIQEEERLFFCEKIR